MLARNWRVWVQFIDFPFLCLNLETRWCMCTELHIERQPNYAYSKTFFSFLLPHHWRVFCQFVVRNFLLVCLNGLKYQVLTFKLVTLCCDSAVLFCFVGHTWLVYECEIICISCHLKKPCGISHEADRRQVEIANHGKSFDDAKQSSRSRERTVNIHKPLHYVHFYF